MGKVIVLSGISGSGKSTYAEKLLQKTQGVKVSADHFFMVPDHYEESGAPYRYCFDASKLGEAHADCFYKFIQLLGWEDSTKNTIIIVDNTNCSVEELSPYMLGAAAFGWEAEVHTLWVKPNQVRACAERNVHGVSLDVVSSQEWRLSQRKLPKYWKCVDVLQVRDCTPVR